MRITFAEEKDKAALKSFWKDTFGDTDAYVDLFFSQKMRTTQTVVAWETQEIASMLYLVDAPLLLADGTEVAAFYICGVATKPAYRNRGLAGELMHFALRHAAQCGAKVCYLIPATPALFGYYARFGFQCCSYVKKGVLQGKAGKIPAYTTAEDIDQVAQMYQVKAMPFKPKRSRADWACIYGCYDSVLRFADGYMVLSETEDTVYLLEQSIAGTEIAQAIAAQKGKKIEFILPGTATDTPFAMAKSLDNRFVLPREGYIQLMMN